MVLSDLPTIPTPIGSCSYPSTGCSISGEGSLHISMVVLRRYKRRTLLATCPSPSPYPSTVSQSTFRHQSGCNPRDRDVECLFSNFGAVTGQFHIRSGKGGGSRKAITPFISFHLQVRPGTQRTRSRISLRWKNRFGNERAVWMVMNGME